MKNRTDREFLEWLYHDGLERIATPDEFNVWISRIEKGQTWEQVLRDFTESAEFHFRVQALIHSLVGFC